MKGYQMDKIKVGDVLKMHDIRITVTEIYLFQMHPEDNFEPIIVYDWQKGKRMVKDMSTFDMDWEGWEKV